MWECDYLIKMLTLEQCNLSKAPANANAEKKGKHYPILLP